METLDELAGSDLLVRAGAEGRERWTISEAGSAHLRRSRAADRDTAFGTQHRDLVVERIETEAGPGTISRNAAESPLAWLRRRKDRDGEPMIDSAAFEAGERLRRDLTLGGVLPSVTARWDGTVGGGSGALRDPAAAADATIAARQRARRALDAVGSDLANLLVDLCGFLKGIETIEREQRWPPRSAKVVIRLALRRLAEHYGLETEARGPDRSRGIRLWREAEAGANSSATLSPPPAEPLPGCG